MKTLDLELMGVQEMNMQEMKAVDGGWIITAIILTVIFILASTEDAN